MNEAQTSHMYAVGVCKEVGTYAGGFFVAPNSIDISKLTFAHLFENPIGLILVAVIFGLFFLLLYWALRKDKQDRLLVSFHHTIRSVRLSVIRFGAKTG